MPVYNGSKTIKDSIESILRQNYRNFEIYIVDDCSTDNTGEIVKSIKDKRIHYFKNSKNLGYGKNLEKCKTIAGKNSDITYLMAQDDLIRKGNFKKVNEVFNKYPNVGAIIRPFYMFTDDIHRPIRDFGPYDRSKDSILSLKDGEPALQAIFRTVCQLSGLAFRTRLLKLSFHSDVMTSHIYPFLDIFKNYDIMFLKDYTIAVRTYSSQTRSVPKIYEISPTQAWLDLVDYTFREKKFQVNRKICKKIVVRQGYVGLVQLRNFSTFKILIREYIVLVKNDPFYVFYPRFWLYFLTTLIIPGFILLPMVDFYKDKILSRYVSGRELVFIKA